MLRTLLLGYLFLTGSVFAGQDLCRQRNTHFLCEGNLGIPRCDMPQVDLVKESIERQWGVVRTRLPAHQLTAVQGEINKEIVFGMLRNQTFDPCEREIFVVNNGTHHNIIDGHHTYSACRLRGGEQRISMVCGFIHQVLNRLKQLPNVFFLQLDDSLRVDHSPLD